MGIERSCFLGEYIAGLGWFGDVLGWLGYVSACLFVVLP